VCSGLPYAAQRPSSLALTPRPWLVQAAAHSTHPPTHPPTHVLADLATLTLFTWGSTTTHELQRGSALSSEMRSATHPHHHTPYPTPTPHTPIPPPPPPHTHTHTHTFSNTLPPRNSHSHARVHRRFEDPDAAEACALYQSGARLDDEVLDVRVDPAGFKPGRQLRARRGPIDAPPSRGDGTPAFRARKMPPKAHNLLGMRMPPRNVVLLDNDDGSAVLERVTGECVLVLDAHDAQL
jgi:hypothetical protein